MPVELRDATQLQLRHLDRRDLACLESRSQVRHEMKCRSRVMSVDLAGEDLGDETGSGFADRLGCLFLQEM
jgi:hypothetical protein